MDKTMKQAVKRVLALVLACTLSVPTVLGQMPHAVAATPSYDLYQETFDGTMNDLLNAGWNSVNSSKFTVNANKKLEATGDANWYFCLDPNDTNGASEWENYEFEADVQMTWNQIKYGIADAGLVVGSQGSANSGNPKGAYAFYHRFDQANSKYYFCLDKWSATGGVVNNLWKVEQSGFMSGSVTHKMTIQVDGNQIACYVDGNQIGTTYTDTEVETIKGSIGVYAGRRTTYFDNMKVKMTTYAQQLQPGELYRQTFDRSMKVLAVEGWSSAKTSEFKINANKQLEAIGKANYNFCLDPNAENGAAEWQDYEFEADVRMTWNQIQTGTADAGLIVGSQGSANSGNPKGGYVFYHRFDQTNSKYYFRLDKYSATGGAVNNLWEVEQSGFINNNTDRKMTVQVNGNRISCYVDGVQIGTTYTDTEVETIKGSIGVYAGRRTTYFDNMLVKSLVWHQETLDGDLDSFTADGWDENNKRYFSIVDEKLVSNKDTVTSENKEACVSKFWCMQSGTTNRYEWSNYSFESEITLKSDDVTGATGHANIGLVVGHKGDSNAPKDGYVFFVNRNRFSGALSYILSKYNSEGTKMTELWSVPAEGFSLDTPHQMKIRIDYNRVGCYIDGELVGDIYTDATVQAIQGSIGLFAAGKVCVFDNLCVRNTVAEPTIEEDNTPVVEDPNFMYSQLYEIPLKKVVTTGWDPSGRKNFKIEDGQLVSIDVNSNTTWLLNQREGATEWSNYTIEADITVTDQVVSGTTAWAGLFVGSDGVALGYEFSIVAQNGKYFCTMWDRTAEGHGAGMGSASYGFKLNEAYTLKVALKDNTINCYIDDELMISTTVDGKSLIQGTVGIRQFGNVCKYDNIYVYPTIEDDSNALLDDVRGQNPWFIDRFDSMDSLMKERGWSTEFSIEKGAVQLVGTGGGYVALNGIEECEKWSNYTVVADVIVSDNEEHTSSSTNPISGIRALSTDSKNGYELGLMFKGREEPGVLVLRRVRDNTILSEYKEVAIERGKSYQLALSVYGNTFRGYINGKEAFTIMDDSNQFATGSIALYKSGFQTAYDNVTIYEGKLITVGEAISPATGDYSMNTALWISAAILTPCMIYLVNEKRKKSRKV